MFGKIKVTEFGRRHFEKKSGGTKITDLSVEEFEREINVYVDSCYFDEESPVLDGYAPFCKLISIENFTNAKIGTMPITLENYQYLRSGYSARTEKELPILSRWFELPLPAPKADYLMVVVYSKEQIDKEGRMLEGEGNNPDEKYIPFDADWGVVAILGQTHSNEEPMSPITMMRNALGIEEGGSGVPLDREKYAESVEFWTNNAMIKS